MGQILVPVMNRAVPKHSATQRRGIRTFGRLYDLD